MTEIRRDTDSMDLSAIHEAFASHRRDTLPLPIVLEVAAAQQISVVPCPLCHVGIVATAVADRVAEVIAVDPDEEQPITLVEAAQ